MKLFSSAFANFEAIPIKHTGEGDDISPPLRWQEVPEGTHSLALICEDPDAPHGTWDHWILYNIPPTMSVLAEGIKQSQLPHDIQTGLNTAGTNEYVGPNPPSGIHRYFFKLYALDTVFQFPGGLTKTDLIKAMSSHILGEATLVGVYERKHKQK
jgi:Raf kinase inhibitor-like YbhB/YbcL family protein